MGLELRGRQRRPNRRCFGATHWERRILSQQAFTRATVDRQRDGRGSKENPDTQACAGTCFGAERRSIGRRVRLAGTDLDALAVDQVDVRQQLVDQLELVDAPTRADWRGARQQAGQDIDEQHARQRPQHDCWRLCERGAGPTSV